jgi:uncharacterized membrane protein YkvA (DUF1232 family)
LTGATRRPQSAPIFRHDPPEDGMAFEPLAVLEFASKDESRSARNEETVRRDFWPKFKRFAAKLPFAEDLLTAYYCAFDRETPLQIKGALVAALAYFVLPFDFIPDILPIIGFADDAAVLATAILMVAGHIKPAHREAAREALKRVLDEAT